MPTTSSGIPYTVYSATVPGAGTVYWGVPDSLQGTPNLKVLLYAHGAQGAANQFAELAGWLNFRNWVIDNGWCWIEGTGGGGSPWGNPASESAYNVALDYVDSILSIGTLVALGRSMGGAVMSRLYQARRGSDSRWKGLIVNSGVQDLVWAYDYGPDRWTAAFNSAWKVTTKDQFLAAVAGLNPVDGPASSWEGANVLQLVGSADTTVLPERNGLAMRAMYAGRPALDLVDVRIGGDHSSANGSYTQVKPMADFLTLATGGSIDPPEIPNAYRVLSELWMDPQGRLHKSHSR